ncbi:hypothetical protein E3Q10_02322 [Wallemia mellicola]|uniref:Uncharacterized protein n=1 Tax=Wallemia mellicola TaxID=1708541 RepID=A0A4T0QDQ7_9BASI|nr:hypothetical protein E3Q12_02950 [Wallemia mellicola]TIC29933.1 hypothetical protein E3Q10_02322 [Wallemia mellicola]TIC54489.1 hypothetical protein E3Q04_02538 [Wallemia mellicola]
MVVQPIKCLIELSKAFRQQHLPKVIAPSNSIPGNSLDFALTRSKKYNNRTFGLSTTLDDPTNNQLGCYLSTLPSNICVISNYDPYVHTLVDLLKHQKISAALRFYRHSIHDDLNTGGKNVYFAPRVLVTISFAIISAKFAVNCRDIDKLNNLAQCVHDSLRNYLKHHNSCKPYPYAVSRTLIYNSSDRYSMNLMTGHQIRRVSSFIRHMSMQLGESRFELSERLRKLSSTNTSKISRNINILANNIDKGSKSASALFNSSHLLRTSRSRLHTSSLEYKTQRAIIMKKLQSNIEHNNRLDITSTSLHNLIRLSLTVSRQSDAFRVSYKHFQKLLKLFHQYDSPEKFQPESTPTVASIKAKNLRRRILTAATTIMDASIHSKMYTSIRYANRVFHDLANGGVLHHATIDEYDALIRLFWKTMMISPHWKGRVGLSRALRVYKDAYSHRGLHDDGSIWRKHLRKHEKMIMTQCVNYMSSDLENDSRIDAIKHVLETFEALSCSVREELLAKVIKMSPLSSKEQLARIIKALNDFASKRIKEN